MSGFIEYLESRAAQDTKVRAMLRRSLAFPPGAFVPAYPYVEPFVKDREHAWRREAHYLVAGLWAAHWRERLRGPAVSLGKACALAAESASSEQRFINLLDADTDQLPHRLRQMVALLKDQPIDFDALLRGLLYWNDEGKRTQNAWARDFYRSLEPASEDEVIIRKGEAA